jgi:hypothetical protein
MKATMDSRRGGLILALSLLILVAGCARGPQAIPAAGVTVTATPDPLYSIHCPRDTKNTFLCYPGENLLGDNTLMEKAASDFCVPKVGRCSLFIWKDEASVGQTYPLTDAETRSLIATYLWNWVTYDGCYKAFRDGETVYSSGNCSQQ